MAKTLAKGFFEFDSYYIPVLHHKEYRTSVRFSITKKGLVIRSPLLSNSKSIRAKAEFWVKNLIESKPAAVGAFKLKEYKNGDTLILYGKPYKLIIVTHMENKDKVKWHEELIALSIKESYNIQQRNNAIKNLLVAYAKRKFKKPLTQRVHEINNLYFRTSVNKVTLKHNHSNWGSCSSKGNINLSIRLLFAPPEIIDYVIIHELAHRIELNHSKRFWAIVQKACPEYKKHERWLKENSHLCEF